MRLMKLSQNLSLLPFGLQLGKPREKLPIIITLINYMTHDAELYRQYLCQVKIKENRSLHWLIMLFILKSLVRAGKLISPDLCGPLYERIESKAGGMAIFMNSARRWHGYCR